MQPTGTANTHQKYQLLKNTVSDSSTKFTFSLETEKPCLKEIKTSLITYKLVPFETQTSISSDNWKTILQHSNSNLSITLIWIAGITSMASSYAAAELILLVNTILTFQIHSWALGGY